MAPVARVVSSWHGQLAMRLTRATAGGRLVGGNFFPLKLMCSAPICGERYQALYYRNESCNTQLADRRNLPICHIVLCSCVNSGQSANSAANMFSQTTRPV